MSIFLLNSNMYMTVCAYSNSFAVMYLHHNLSCILSTQHKRIVIVSNAPKTKIPSSQLKLCDLFDCEQTHTQVKCSVVTFKLNFFSVYSKIGFFSLYHSNETKLSKKKTKNELIVHFILFFSGFSNDRSHAHKHIQICN